MVTTGAGPGAAIYPPVSRMQSVVTCIEAIHFLEPVKTFRKAPNFANPATFEHKEAWYRVVTKLEHVNAPWYLVL